MHKPALHLGYDGPARAMPAHRATALRDEWRSIRRAWLVSLARQRVIPPETLAYLNRDEVTFVQTVRARGLSA